MVRIMAFVKDRLTSENPSLKIWKACISFVEVHNFSIFFLLVLNASICFHEFAH